MTERKPNRAIVSGICGGGWGEIASLTWPTVIAYAEKHGVAFVQHEVDQFHRPAAWLKLLYMAQCFSVAGIEEVLWMDADVVVVDDTKNIFHEVPPDAVQAMCFRDGHWNSGVWLLRRTGLSILVEAAMRDSCIFHNWWEQQAVNEIISERDVSTHNLREEWNAWKQSENVLPRFFHACGAQSFGERISLIRNAMERSR
jgi:hypothetical protein